MLHRLLPHTLPLIGSRHHENIGRVFVSQLTNGFEHTVALNEHRININLLAIDHTAFNRLVGAELILLVTLQLIANEAIA